MDHLAVARGDPVADAAGGLGHDHPMAAQGESPGYRETDHAGSDDENVHPA
jgi:hypothetical protein